jgi:8-oxo-dGTP diphosphatase
MNRFMLIPEVHLLLGENKILLLRRYHTGYEDGNYSVVAGHVDGNEPATVAMAREAYEEAGIVIDPADLVLAHLMHRKAHEERMSLFFTAKQWHGEPANKEPEKCDDLRWFALDALPPNMVGYVFYAFSQFWHGTMYSEYGWQRAV